jgi:CRP-like cAMP-binding protein/Fe-S-cluster-containing hydrogenase component 2
MQPSHPKSHAPHSIEQRVAALRQLDQFSHIAGSELRILAEHAVLRMFEPRTLVIVERAAAHTFFLLFTGHAEQSMRAANGDSITLAFPGRGAVFGEGGLFGQRQRRTAVRSQTRVSVLQWSYDALQAQKDQLPQTFHLLQAIYREHLLYTTLAQVPQLAFLDAADRAAIAQQVHEHRFERGADIVRAGTDRSGVYIIAEGQVRAIYADQTVAVLNPGAVFGEMSFVDDAPHEATICALTPVHVLEIPGLAFEQLLTEHAQVMQQLRMLADERRASDRSPQHIAITKRLLDTGIARGNTVLVKQVDQCDPGCKRCEEACSDRFEVPRLHFGGTTIGAWETPDLCRHCQWGAECAEACPEDAFSITEQGHLIITDRCTGCGACITACPYDAINQVPTYPAPHGLLDQLRFALHPPAATGFKANKCDACHGYNDHACVSACPTGALRWIPIEELYRATK